MVSSDGKISVIALEQLYGTEACESGAGLNGEIEQQRRGFGFLPQLGKSRRGVEFAEPATTTTWEVLSYRQSSPVRVGFADDDDG